MRTIDLTDQGSAREELDPFEVLRLAKRGLTAQEAADELGYSMWYVRNTAREIGATFRDPRAFTPEQVDHVVLMHSRGYSLREIAAQVGKSYSGVRKTLVARGLG